MKSKLLIITVLVLVTANLALSIIRLEQIKRIALEVQNQQTTIERIEKELFRN